MPSSKKGQFTFFPCIIQVLKCAPKPFAHIQVKIYYNFEYHNAKIVIIRHTFFYEPSGVYICNDDPFIVRLLIRYLYFMNFSKKDIVAKSKIGKVKVEPAEKRDRAREFST